MRFLTQLFFVLLLISNPVRVSAQLYPPGQFSIDNIPLFCGNLPTIVTVNIPDMAMTNGQAILLNPSAMAPLPTVLKLYIYAHECGHIFTGPNETYADCWAIQTGRNQGWFPPAAFGLLIRLLENNPGDVMHPPGMIRLQDMMNCYQN